MQIIPVIDVRHGVAVVARGGQRDRYEPLLTPLVDSCDPVDIAKAYLDLFPFEAIYVADLDGIEGRGADVALIPRLLEGVGQRTSFWIDCGLRDVQSAAGLWEDPRVTVVLGTESLHAADNLQSFSDRAGRLVLSLDFQGEGFLGPPKILQDAELWPDRLIVMTLERVGGSGGPDLDRIAEIVARGPGRNVFAAGGIRNRSDCEAVRSAGASGALIASALHNKNIKADDLQLIASL